MRRQRHYDTVGRCKIGLRCRAMALYRAFLMTEDEHIAAFHLLECADDLAVMEEAAGICGYCSFIEVWEGAGSGKLPLVHIRWLCEAQPTFHTEQLSVTVEWSGYGGA
jgi:hypothetical protein